MTKTANPKIFITGIPTAGKSYLASRLTKETGGYCLETDTLRDTLVKKPEYSQWAHFFDKENEFAYYTGHSPEEQWQILEDQHKQLWPGVLAKIREYEDGKIPLKSRLAARVRKPLSKNRPLIFEGINILPSLARKDLDFPGVVLVGKSFEEVLEKNRKRPRWGTSEKMLRMGAEAFWYVERPHYIAEAERYGYKIFEDADEAYEEIVKMLKLK